MASEIELYCTCRSPYTDAEFMIQCDFCEDWFHGRCVDLTETASLLIKKYACPACTAAGLGATSFLKSSKKATTLKSQGSIHPLRAGTPEFIEWVRAKQFLSDAEVPVRHVLGTDLTAQLLEETGFHEPFVVDSSLGPPPGLRVPPPSFTPRDVTRYVRASDALDVIDVRRQQDCRMTLSEYIEYFERKPRTDIFNILSLEISETPLDALISPPGIVQEVSWVDRFWPSGSSPFKKSEDRNAAPSHSERSRRAPSGRGFDDDWVRDSDGFDDDDAQVGQSGKHFLSKPRVSKYCLLSPAGSYTDFHIDFGGTSVWYHVLSGQKEFIIARPTPENLRAFEQWMWLEKRDRSESWLGEKLTECYRFFLNGGDTLLMPAGWIHSVITPIDSVVFGGNFLCDFNVPLHLQIYELEKRMITPNKLMFPSFQTLHWYAAKGLAANVEKLLSRHKPVPEHLANALPALLAVLKSWTADKKVLKTNKPNIPDAIDYRELLPTLSRRCTDIKAQHKEPPSPPVTPKASKKSKTKRSTDDASQSDSSDAPAPNRKRKRNGSAGASPRSRSKKAHSRSPERASVDRSETKASKSSHANKHKHHHKHHEATDAQHAASSRESKVALKKVYASSSSSSVSSLSPDTDSDSDNDNDNDNDKGKQMATTKTRGARPTKASTKATRREAKTSKRVTPLPPTGDGDSDGDSDGDGDKKPSVPSKSKARHKLKAAPPPEPEPETEPEPQKPTKSSVQDAKADRAEKGRKRSKHKSHSRRESDADHAPPTAVPSPAPAPAPSESAPATKSVSYKLTLKIPLASSSSTPLADNPAAEEALKLKILALPEKQRRAALEKPQFMLPISSASSNAGSSPRPPLDTKVESAGEKVARLPPIRVKIGRESVVAKGGSRSPTRPAHGRHRSRSGSTTPGADQRRASDRDPVEEEYLNSQQLAARHERLSHASDQPQSVSTDAASIASLLKSIPSRTRASFANESDEEPEMATISSAMFPNQEKAPPGSLMSSMGSVVAGPVKTPATPSPLSPSSPSGALAGGAYEEAGGRTRPPPEPNEIERRLMEIRAKQKQQIFKRDFRAKEAQRKHYGHDDFVYNAEEDDQGAKQKQPLLQAPPSPMKAEEKEDADVDESALVREAAQESGDESMSEVSSGSSGSPSPSDGEEVADGDEDGGRRERGAHGPKHRHQRGRRAHRHESAAHGASGEASQSLLGFHSDYAGLTRGPLPSAASASAGAASALPKQAARRQQPSTRERLMKKLKLPQRVLSRF